MSIDRTPCTATDCEHYHSDGSYCIEIDCWGPIGAGIAVKDLVSRIAGGRKEK
jgi:hypothetical protein